MGRIGVLTSGGDAPGMNAAIHAVFHRAKANKLKVMGIKKGYKGLINDEIFELKQNDVEGICNRGGTFLKSARSERFKSSEGINQAVKNLKYRNINGLVVIGGNGSLKGVKNLATKTDINVIGIPSSIDNDINGSDLSIGFSTVCHVVTKSIDNIKDTAISFHTNKPRIFAIEAMGRKSGWISIMAGMAGEVDLIVIPEQNPSVDSVASKTKDVLKEKNDCIILYAEGIDNSDDFANNLAEKLDYRVRLSILGFQQRGGVPTTNDRILALRMGNAAVDEIIKGESGKFITIQENKITPKNINNKNESSNYENYLELFSDKIVK